jgi:hypothetical protein
MIMTPNTYQSLQATRDEKWTPFFRPRNAEFKLGFQVLLGLGFLGFTALRSHHYT